MTAAPIHLASVSGGKDSTATLLLALTQFPSHTAAVFADTGNEHDLTYEYLQYLEARLALPVTRLRANFDADIAHRRTVVAGKWVNDGVPQSQIDEALAVLHPSGNPFLDLCLVKGRFPSRMAQFCTQELKTKPLTEFALQLVEATDCDVWSWQGVRRDESQNRRNAQGHESLTGRLWAHRPIAGWTAQQTVDFVVKVFGVRLNPLYEMEMGRVGCMPCINANKDELAAIARRFPEHIDRIATWERLVASVSKRLGASFFVDRDEDRTKKGGSVWARVEWARTLHGGKVVDPQWSEPAPACASSYGLCE